MHYITTEQFQKELEDEYDMQKLNRLMQFIQTTKKPNFIISEDQAGSLADLFLEIDEDDTQSLEQILQLPKNSKRIAKHVLTEQQILSALNTLVQ